jgi:hypothetical protein
MRIAQLWGGERRLRRCLNCSNLTYDVFGQFVAGKVLDVLVRGVDDFGELLALDHLLEDVHGDAV